jgi:ABC-type transport system substrate-binding protein
MRETNYWQRLHIRRIRRRSLLQGTATALGALGVATVFGCGDDDSNGDAGSPATGGSPAGGGAFSYPAPPKYSDLKPQELLAKYHWSKIAPTTQVLGQPRSGGVVVFPTASFGLQSLSPTEESVGQWPFCFTHNNLLGMDFRYENRAVDTQPVTTRNSVSTGWEQPDETSYTFKLRPDVRWHNIAPANGAPLTVDDIRETYQLFKTSTFHGKRFESIQSIDSPESGVVRIKMSTPYSPIINVLRVPAFGILNAKHIAEGPDALKSKAIGTGPFTQGKFVPNQVRVYERNKDYWLKDDRGTQLPYLDGIVHTVIADPAATLAAYRTGQVDAYKPTSAEEFTRLLEELAIWGQVNPGFCGCSSPSLAMSYRDPALKDVRVRRAISMALDKQDMIDTIYGGGATMRSFIPWMWLGREFPKTLEDLGQWSAYNPQEAKSLLQSAGRDSLKLDLYFTGQVLPGTGAPSGDPLVESIQRDLKDIGVEVDLKPLDVLGSGRTFYGQQWNGLFRRGAGSATALGSDDFLSHIKAGSGLNGAGVNDPRVEEMIDKINKTFKLEDQQKINQDIDKYVAEDQMVFGARVPDTFAYTTWKKYLHNVIETPNWWITGGGGQLLTEAWVDDSAPKRDIGSF